MRAYLNLRHSVGDRVQAFEAGLRLAGFSDVHMGAGRGDLLITWNRIGHGEAMARECERSGIPVIVAENPSWSTSVPGQWLHVTRSRHNTAGVYPVGPKQRWDDLGVALAPWRRNEGEVVILAQRGIGSPPVAQPFDWHTKQKGRLRLHPGRLEPRKTLREDLAHAGKVVTWGSAAAVQALIWGIPVESHMPNWIGAQDNTDAGRLAMFRRMAWAQWTHEEIGSGKTFAHLLTA